MLWFKILAFAAILVSQWYMLHFKDSSEGKDERGKGIQYKVNDKQFGVLYIGVIMLVILELLDIVPVEVLPDLLLFICLSLSMVGAFFTFFYKRKQNY